MKTLLITTTPKFALRACMMIALATYIFVSSTPAEADPLPLCIPPPLNLVAWWSGDGHPNDIRGSNNGTLQGNATYAAGEVAQAFKFDTEPEYVKINSTGIVKGLSEATVDAWVRPLGPHTLGGGHVWMESTSTQGFSRLDLAVLNDGRIVVERKGYGHGGFGNRQTSYLPYIYST